MTLEVFEAYKAKGETSFLETMRQIYYLDTIHKKYPKMSVQNYLTFTYVCLNPGINMSEIQHKLGCDNQSMHRYVCQLSKPTKKFVNGLGLIMSIMDEDNRRSRLLYPTQQGLQLMAELNAGFDHLHNPNNGEGRDDNKKT